MKKFLFLIPLILFFACSNDPNKKDQPAGDTTVITNEGTGDQPAPKARSVNTAARAVLPSGVAYDTLANGDTLFYIKKDTTVTVSSQYSYPIERVELHPKKPSIPPTNRPPVARAGS